MEKTSLSADAATASTQLTATRIYGSKKDVACMLGVSLRSVDNLIRKGCPYIAFSSRKLIFDLTEVRGWIATNFRTQRRGTLKGDSL